MYRLECSLCDLSFRTRAEWHEHLLQAPHQAEVRVKGLRFFTKCRVQALVLFAKFPLACREVLEYFSRADNPITEFVLWTKVPGFVVLIFESREQAEKAFVSVKGPTIQIKERPVEIRKAYKYLEMEWEHLLPPLGLPMSSEKRSCDTINVSKRKKFKDDNLSEMKGLLQAEEMTPENGTDSSFVEKGLEEVNASLTQNLADNLPTKNRGDSGDEDVEIVEHQPQDIEAETVDLSDDDDDRDQESELKEPAAGPEQSDSGIVAEFKEMFNQLKISDETFQAAQKLQADITEIIGAIHPNCQLYMFRHWYLGIKSSGTDELIFVVDYIGRLEGKRRNPRVTQPNLIDILGSEEAQVKIPGLKPVPPPNDATNPSEPGGTTFFHEPTGLHLQLVMGSQYLIEAQTARLVEHLCEFDPRVKPLLQFVAYRARLKNIRIFPLTSQRRSYGESLFAPEPAALDWLVLFFFCYKGLIPTPRRLRGTASKKYRILGNIDLRFATSPKLLGKWVCTSGASKMRTDSEEFYWSVVELARDFFEFYAALGSDTFVLNTMDGEIYPRSLCRDEIRDQDSKKYCITKEKAFTRLTPAQHACLQEGPMKNFVQSEKPGVLILHPFSFSTHLAVSYQQFEKSLIRAKHLEQKLTELLTQYRGNRDVRFPPVNRLFALGKMPILKVCDLRRKIKKSRKLFEDILEKQGLLCERECKRPKTILDKTPVQQKGKQRKLTKKITKAENTKSKSI